MKRICLLLLPLVLWKGRHAAVATSLPGGNLALPTVSQDNVEPATPASQSHMRPQPTEQPVERQVGMSGPMLEPEPQQNSQLKHEGILPQELPDNKNSSHPAKSLSQASISRRQTDQDELLKRLLREAQKTRSGRNRDEGMGDEIDGGNEERAPRIIADPPGIDEELDYGDDDDPLTCDDVPCGEGQRTCRKIKGFFVCTCMPGYSLHKVGALQPLCIKLDNTESTGTPDGVVDEAPNAKWAVGWSVLGVVLGLALLAVIIWAIVVMYQRAKSTASRNVQDEFTSLLDDKKSSVDTMGSYTNEQKPRQDDGNRGNFHIGQEQLDAAML